MPNHSHSVHGSVRNVCYVGAGYVGSLSAIAMAKMKPYVEIEVVDINLSLVDAWNSDKLPIFEPGLDDLFFGRSSPPLQCILNARAEAFFTSQGLPTQTSGMLTPPGRLPNLTFSTDVKSGIERADVIFLCVNTPLNDETLNLETGNVDSAIDSIARFARNHTVVVEKSTVPCGMAERVMAKLHKESITSTATFAVLSNPEFLAQGSALKDLLEPSRVVIGWLDEQVNKGDVDALIALYTPWVAREKIITTDAWSSELAKLASNALVAQRISSINTLSAICEATNADADQVSRIAGLDPRIGSLALSAGMGFGGSCLKKDVLCLVYIARSLGLHQVADYWNQVVEMNDYQNERIVDRALAEIPVAAMRKIAILGFAFKKDTADTRSSPAVGIVKQCIEQQVHVSVFDPVIAKAKIAAELERSACHDTECIDNIVTNNIEDACRNASVVIIHTDWDHFSDAEFVNWSMLYDLMLTPKIVFPLRGKFDTKPLANLGFRIMRVGKRS